VQKPGKLGRFQTVLNSEFENELAFDLAKNGIAHPLNTENGCAGKDWKIDIEVNSDFYTECTSFVVLLLSCNMHWQRSRYASRVIVI